MKEILMQIFQKYTVVICIVILGIFEAIFSKKIDTAGFLLICYGIYKLLTIK